MPVYEYRCRGCDHTLEELVRRNIEPTVCPSCGRGDLERLISLPNVRSESTRGLAMKAAKKRDRRQGRDRLHERTEYEESHD